ncbi:MAG TPA: SDR family oxidoreductase [Rhizomicrobium sp.]|nr:SDR family oxidoreductase [Rhizomicrobium sp.]
MTLSLPQPFDLTGRTALITGAGGLLGPQHAIALAETGASVVLADIDLARAEAACEQVCKSVPGAQTRALLLDVTQPEMVRQAAATLGRIGILVNNAAIDAKVTAQPGVANGSRLEVFPLGQWNIEVSVGLTGAMLTAQVFGAQMAENGGGVILNIASDLSVFAPDQRIYRRDDVANEMEQPVKPVTYSAIKHGLLGLTKYLATYWATQGVRCNALSPGGVFNGQGDAFVARLTSLIPMGRMARPDEYRAAVQFLCSDASSYMTGQNIVMDGGRSVL